MICGCIDVEYAVETRWPVEIDDLVAVNPAHWIADPCRLLIFDADGFSLHQQKSDTPVGVSYQVMIGARLMAGH